MSNPLENLLGNAEALALATAVVNRKPVARKKKATAPAKPKELTVVDGGIGLLEDGVKVVIYETGCGKNWYLYDRPGMIVMSDCASLIGRNVEGIPNDLETAPDRYTGKWEYLRDTKYSRDFELEREMAKQDERIDYEYALEADHPVFVR